MAASGAGLGALLLGAFPGRAIAAEELLSTMDVGLKKRLADVALNTAKSAGCSYCDVRVGRYLRQFVVTRERMSRMSSTPSPPGRASASSPVAPGALPPPTT
ncbi:hypothetical protein P0F65_13950 [Sphingomonas sp. I4]